MDRYTVHPIEGTHGVMGWEVRKNERQIRPGVSECDESFDFNAGEESDAYAFAERMNKAAQQAQAGEKDAGGAA